MFDYLNYKNTFPLKLFSIGEIPQINKNSVKFMQYWKPEKRRVVEGRWVDYQGEWKWVPGTLHFYVNHWHILLKEATGKSKTKSIGKPQLRDLEWIKHYVYACARGFSGFELDTQFTCHREIELKPNENLVDLQYRIENIPKHIRETLYTIEGKYKTYMPALEYLYQYFKKNLGKPMYWNMALNVVDIESRGTGKSYTMGCLCGHNFLTDGAMDYDEYLAKSQSKEPLSSETLVGAIDTKYSNDLIKKIKLGLDNLEGWLKVGKEKQPAPFSKKHTGSWESGGTVIAESDVKEGGIWIRKGSKSKIQHRTFSSNPFAANGTRAGFNVLDEVGFMDNLEQALGQMAECTADGADKFGTIWMCGTGGDMAGGATHAVKSVFYDPAANACMEFDDLFENSGKKIGFFIPAWMGLNQFKDELGNTLKERAIAYLEDVRKTKKLAKSKKPYEDELQQRPLKPSEAFLLSSGNKFPVGELMKQLNAVDASSDPAVHGMRGRLVINELGKIEFEPDLHNHLRQVDFPATTDNIEGCVVIYHQPIDMPPWGLYIAGHDPYAQSSTNSSPSVGSTYIMMRATPGISNQDVIVAEYVGRPESMKEHTEIVRRLLIYYNAVCLYENNINNLRDQFEIKNALYLLAKSPTILKATISGHLVNNYGLRMSKQIKEELEIYLNNWLLEEVEEGKLNLHFVNSAPLLKELIGYNDDGNFDRVISLMLVIAQKQQMHRIIAKQKVEAQRSSNFFDRKLFN